MSTTTRTRKPLQPVSGVCRWIIRPVVARGVEVGLLAINDTEYAATVCREGGTLQGIRLTKPDRTVYHVDLTTGHCDCPDHAYRGRECKHHKAVVAALAALN